MNSTENKSVNLANKARERRDAAVQMMMKREANIFADDFAETRRSRPF